MSSRRRGEEGRYLAGALVLIALMVIAVVLGWYGLEIAKQSFTNSTSVTNTTSFQPIVTVTNSSTTTSSNSSGTPTNTS
jgi:cytoskeletal protein RodZ